MVHNSVSDLTMIILHQGTFCKFNLCKIYAASKYIRKVIEVEVKNKMIISKKIDKVQGVLELRGFEQLGFEQCGFLE